MNIVLLNDDALPVGRGGTAVVVDRIRRSYAQGGHRVTLITTHQNDARNVLLRKTDAAGETISVFRRYDLRKRHRLCLRDPIMNATLDMLLAELRPDVVHAHNLHTYLTYEALLIARKHTSKVFLTAHDVLLTAFHRVNQERYLRHAREGKVYRMHWWEHVASVGRKYWPLRNPSIRNILRSSGTQVIAVSHALRCFLEANGITVAGVVYNGVPVLPPPETKQVAAFRKQCGLEGPTILFGGRISVDKGIVPLLKAFECSRKTLAGIQLLIVGQERCLDDFASIVSSETQKAIRCVGWMTPDEMRVAYAASSIVTTPSLCLDTFNLMNAEGMMAGKPVISTCFGGAPEIIVHGETGYVVDPRDTEQYASYMRTLLQNPERAEAMGKRGKQRAMQLLTTAAQVAAYQRMFTSTKNVEHVLQPIREF